MTNIGKHAVFNEGFRNGRSMIAMWTNPIAIYKRSNNTFFIVACGKRTTITRRANGSFYLRTDTP